MKHPNILTRKRHGGRRGVRAGEKIGSETGAEAPVSEPICFRQRALRALLAGRRARGRAEPVRRASSGSGRWDVSSRHRDVSSKPWDEVGGIIPTSQLPSNHGTPDSGFHVSDKFLTQEIQTLEL